MKNILILGDSYSTYKNLIPEGFSTWYPGNDVKSAEETWWKIALRGAEADLILNSSFSGTTVCHTGYSGDCSDKSFLARLEKLAENGFFEKNKIDELWIFGGTNDSWANSPIGEITYEEVSFEEKFKVLPGFSALLALAKSLPIGKILVLLNSEMKPEIENGFAEIAAHYGVPTLRLHDIDKKDGHPTAKGMAEIAEQFLAFREAL
jgi:hypothetical protein